MLQQDEIDAIGGSRFSEGTSADREIQRTLMELLNQMDGFESQGAVKMVMATNRPVRKHSAERKTTIHSFSQQIDSLVVLSGYSRPCLAASRYASFVDSLGVLILTFIFSVLFLHRPFGPKD